MKTTFILHGGMLKLQRESNDLFLREFTKNLENGDEVLFIGFACQDMKERISRYERDKSLILAQSDKNITVTNATLDGLVEQTKRARAIFVTGGNTEALVEDMLKYPQFREAVRGKVVAGSSAGAALFSTCYLNKDGMRKGLSFVPVKLVFHYGNPEFGTTKERLHLLDECPRGLELLTIEETKWVVREVGL